MGSLFPLPSLEITLKCCPYGNVAGRDFRDHRLKNFHRVPLLCCSSLESGFQVQVGLNDGKMCGDKLWLLSSSETEDKAGKGQHVSRLVFQHLLF